MVCENDIVHGHDRPSQLSVEVQANDRDIGQEVVCENVVLLSNYIVCGHNQRIYDRSSQLPVADSVQAEAKDIE
jgi:hypothetical protein